LHKRERATLLAINALVDRIRENPIVLRFPASLDMNTAVIGAFSDSSFANREDLASQGGYIMTLMSPDVLSGKSSNVSIMSWSSHKVRRVCRSTLSAEAQSGCIALEHGDFLKVLVAESKQADFPLHNYRSALRQERGVLIIDARSVFDFLSTDSGKLPQDRRIALDLRVMRNYLECSSWTLRWVCGPQQLSDCMTKSAGDLRYLSWVCKHAKFQLLRDSKVEERMSSVIQKTGERLEETPEEKKRRRNRQKSTNHRRRDDAVKALTEEITPEQHRTKDHTTRRDWSQVLRKAFYVGLQGLASASIA